VTRAKRRHLQQLLLANGYHIGEADGKIGPVTRTAIADAATMSGITLAKLTMRLSSEGERRAQKNQFASIDLKGSSAGNLETPYQSGKATKQSMATFGPYRTFGGHSHQ
jgi:peptidoglycan hydrolase-like protein with peptidoglycan-binding domain